MPCFSSRGRCKHGRDKKGWLEGWIGQCKWLDHSTGTESLFLFLCICLCVWICTWAQRRPDKSVRSSGTEGIGSCELLKVGSGTKPKSSEKAASTLNYLTTSLEQEKEIWIVGLSLACGLHRPGAAFFFFCDDLKEKNLRDFVSCHITYCSDPV